MIPKIIHQIWIGPDPIPERFSSLISKVKEFHSDWEYHLWHEENLPDGMLRDEWRHKLRAPAERADLLRLDLLYTFGGIYLDVDCDVQRPLGPLLELGAIVIGDLKEGRVNNAVMAAVPGHPILRDLIIAAKPLEYYGMNKETCGPVYLNRMLKPYRSSPDVIFLPPFSFYPAPEEIGKSFVVHLSDRSWKDLEGWRMAALKAERRVHQLRHQLAEVTEQLLTLKSESSAQDQVDRQSSQNKSR